MAPTAGQRPPGPMLLSPILKEKVWGGDRLRRFPSKGVTPGSSIGESWEASGLAEDPSRIASGPWEGASLRELVSELGTALLGPLADRREFPLLLKLIDARERLSLQVHPPHRDDRPQAPPGKAEAWYVLEGGPLVLGLAANTDAGELAAALREARDPSPLLEHVVARPGDTIPVAPGTLHSIGQGVLVAELQQPADITYRVHDWGRQGRELHLEQAFAALDPLAGHRPRPGPLELVRGNNLFSFLTGCRHFGMERARLVEHLPWVRATESVELLLCLEGRFTIGPRSAAQPLAAGPGDTVLLPAACPEVWIEPSEPVTLLVGYPCRLERELYDRMLAWGFAGEEVASRIFPA
ncbi:MAG: class I mannose-6-phosphate isomerase [Candidatus Wallbacteria bacterium]|nr:class I mannose-6-phosphate isomerase [Candidatus Wallbacteria bacterium]